MKLNNRQKQQVLRQFPDTLELYYGSFVHDKVQTYKCNMYQLIPKGKKHILWFRSYKNGVQCYVMEVERKNQRNRHNYKNMQKRTQKTSIGDVYVYNCCFDQYLATGKHGTMCYGTLIHVNGNPYFCIENMMYYKNTSVYKQSWNEKLRYYKNICESIKPIQNTKKDLCIGIPIMNRSRTSLEEIAQSVPYDIYCIEGMPSETNRVYKFKCTVERAINGIFMIKPTITSDIYDVYCESKHLGTAYVPSYKQSVYLNSYFRTIKENTDLDLLEESDDEEEFENVAFDKFVDLDKELPFECMYHSKFKAWVPVKCLVDADQTSITYTPYTKVQYLGK